MSSASVRRGLAVAVAVVSVAPVVVPSSAGLAVTLPLTVAAIAGIGTLWAEERREPLLGKGFVLGLVLVVLLVAVLFPPRRSKDLWAYAFYGRMVNTHQASPYVHPPSDFPTDPGYSRVDPAWRHDTSIYSPGFTWISMGIDRVTGGHPLPSRLAYQGLAAAALGGAAILVLRRTGQPVAGLLVAANPVALVWTVNCGHGDAVMGLATLAAVLAAERRRPALVGLFVGVAALIKLVAILPLLPLAWWLWRRARTDPGSPQGPIAALRAPCIAGVVAMGVVAVSLLIGGGADLLHALRAASVRTSAPSIWRGALELLSAHPTHADRVVLSRVALAVVAVVAVLGSWSRSNRSTPAPGIAVAVVAFIAGAPYTLVWYWAWAVPVLALRLRSRVTVAASALIALQLVLAESPRGGADGVLRGAFTALNWTYRVACVALLGWLAATAVLDLTRRRTSTSTTL